ncbi:acyltransferase [Cellvibrio sp. pealriver]|uniref:acyltransferase family protein n=1 Tax=Cellvibrio sp. pealriver TaxID=1622269 RepID=UPI00066FF36F|nr:acyltransferase [Cellvibrio sp. pealriver]
MHLQQLLNPKSNNLDLFRLVAALLVIYGHAPAFIPNAVSTDVVARLLGFDYSGSLAVKFFFMLSGLLVTMSIMARPQPVEFVIKRIARIFPGLLVCLGITVFIVGPLFTQLSVIEYFTQSATWNYLLHNALLYQLEWNLPGVFSAGKNTVVNGSLWTLPLEMVCYLFLVAFYTLGIWRYRLFSSLFLLAIILASFFLPHFLPPAFANHQEATLLAGCFALGALFATHKDVIQINSRILLALILLSVLLWSSPLKILLFYISFFYACLYLSALPSIVEKLKLPGDASYGVYIYGFVIQQSVAHLFPQQGVVFNQIVSAVVALGFGFMSWFLVEKPAMHAVKNVLSSDDQMATLKAYGVNALQKLSLLFNGKNAINLLALVLIAWATHFVALYFIFPGHYSPLAFHHSDFYIPASFAYAVGDGYSFANLLNWPRPLFMWVYKFTGYFGHPGSVAWVVAVVFLNCALTALLAKRLLRLDFDRKFVLFFALYCFLLFTQPYFYTFYSQDIGSQVSYLLLLSGMYCFLLLSERHVYSGAAIIFVLSCCAFLVKETYILAFGFIAFCWFVVYVRHDWKKAIAPGVAIFVAGVISILINLRSKSVFVNPDAQAGSSYHMDLNPLSVLKELARYASEGIAPIVLLVFALIIFQVHQAYKNRWMTLSACLCLIFAFLSWLPNALLPNHHYEGYSFNGLYVCFLLLFFVVKMAQDNIHFKRVLTAVIVLVLLSPLSSIHRYEGTRNTWVLAMEQVQKNMLAGFNRATAQLIDRPEPIRVLVSGITSPFHPFAFPQSIRSFNGGENAFYYFIPPKDFPANLGNRIDLVHFIAEADKENYTYEQEWKFDDQGNLVEIKNLK